jgi:hypothetical protein
MPEQGKHPGLDSGGKILEISEKSTDLNAIYGIDRADRNLVQFHSNDYEGKTYQIINRNFGHLKISKSEIKKQKEAAKK